MKTVRYITVLALFVAVRAQSQSSQLPGHVLVSKDTVTYLGTTDTASYLPVQIVTTTGNVVVSGNQKVSSTQYNSSTQAQLSNAAVTYVNSFNTSNQKCFVVASAHDVGGFVYNVGAIRTATPANGIDLYLTKINPSGVTVWSYIYNGPNSTTDVGTALTVDGSGNIYITGASDGAYPNVTDYVTIKVSPTGAPIWTQRYNYANYFDIPTSIKLVGSTAVVAGSSGSSPTNYDNCTVSYNATTGSTLTVARTTNTLSGAQDQVCGMETDSLHYIYVAGSRFNGVDYDYQITKLDTNLATVWTRTLNTGFNDAAISLSLDDSLNVYVAGTSYVSATATRLTLLKYTSTGVFRWAIQPPLNNAVSSQGLRVHVKNRNEIFVGGNVTHGTNQDVALLRFNKFGIVTFSKIYNGPQNNTDRFMDLTYDASNHVFVSARTYTPGGLEANVLIQYSYADLPFTPATNTLTGAKYVQSQVIVDFKKAALKMAAINNTDKLFGQLTDFVNDSTCNKITTLLDPDGRLKLNAKTFSTQKIYLSMTDSKTVSVSRMGDNVAIPPVYTHLLLTLPSSLNTASTATQIASISPDICQTQLNFLYWPWWVPNDALYAKQSSIHQTTSYPNAHIHCEKAWDYAKGSSFVRVGIYDSGVEDQHPDFGGNGATTGGCVITNTSYVNNSSSAPDLVGHGTAVAGIVGGRGNDSQGIAGIAGGDATATGTLNNGVSLLNIMIFDPSQFAPSSILASAYMDGATSTGAGGYGMHVMNHSYGNVSTAWDADLNKAINYVNQNGVAFVAARGNQTPANGYNIGTYSSPACLKPGKVMNVGATGTDGHYHKSGVNGTSFNSFTNQNLDFAAPGDTAIVETIIPNYGNIPPFVIANTNSVQAMWGRFSGTSAAAPHVTGIAALMMSNRNQPTAAWDNIVHEDCEAIIKRTATDLASTGYPYYETTGVDTTTGYGRVNADSALSSVQSRYKIRHIDKNHYITSVSTTTSVVSANIPLYWTTSNTFTTPTNLYNCDVIKVVTVYNYNYGTDTYLSAWPLYKASTGFVNVQIGGYVPEDEPNNVELMASSLTSATLQTYCYKLRTVYTNTAIVVNAYYPDAPANLNSAFTLYTLANPVVGIHEQSNEASVEYVNVYPNPSNGHFTVGFNSQRETEAGMVVRDIMGKTVYENPAVPVKYGVNRFDLTLGALPKGIYFLNLDMEGNKSMVKKLIIQ